MQRWTAWLAGPPGTPYEGSEFEVRIAVPDAYPLHPPSLTFATRVFHPNLHFRLNLLLSNQFKVILNNQ